jgi:hypothetical protein
MLEEMLDTWERKVVDEAINRDEGETGDARAKLRRLFMLAASLGHLAKVELAIRDWARRDTAVAEHLKRVDNRRMDYMRSLYGAFCQSEDDIEVRCLFTASLFTSSHLIAADNGPREPRDVMALALNQLLS